MKLRSAVILLVALAACRKPAIDDPAEVAYRHAIELFARASAESHDLTYRDPRFDAVLAALALVPRGDALRASADQLVQQIVLARAEADRADRESADAISQALAPPEFNPRERDAPFPARGKPGAGRPEATAPTASDNVGYGGGGSFSAPPARGPNSRLPDWYRQAGYFGLGQRPGATPPGAVAPTNAAAPTGEATAATGPSSEASATEGTAAPPASSPPTPGQPAPVGPAAVFGLPGPAGRAIMGGR